MMAFLDTEFTDFMNPQLLSLGLVTLDGHEHYVEIDLGMDQGQARAQAASDFVRHGGVLALWGRIPGAATTDLEMGRRTGEWLLALAAGAGRIEVAFDYRIDYELLEYAIRDAGLWGRVRERISPINVSPLTGLPECEMAVEETYRELGRRGLKRHHALADALALRMAYITAKAVALKMAGHGKECQ